MRTKLTSLALGVIIFLVPAAASAHVVVTPNTAATGEERVFSVSAPNERQTTVTQVKLDIPAGVTDVSPSTASGWIITTTVKNDEVSTITWAGQIPAGQRTDFSFSAVMPAKGDRLVWKAFQTYADGTVVSWDKAPTGGSADDNDKAIEGPYSTTNVSSSPSSSKSSNDTTLPLTISLVALVFSILAYTRGRQGSKK